MSTDNLLDNKLKIRVLISYLSSNKSKKDEIIKILINILFTKSDNHKTINSDTDYKPDLFSEGSFVKWALYVVKESNYIRSALQNATNKKDGAIKELKEKLNKNLEELKSNFNNLVDNKDLTYDDNKTWKLSGDRTEIVKKLLDTKDVSEVVKEKVELISEGFIKEIKKLSNELAKDTDIDIGTLDTSLNEFSIVPHKKNLYQFAIEILMKLDEK